MKKEQFESITKWQKETFGSATALSKIAHLKEEIKELEIELCFHDEPEKALMEFADCFTLLFGAADSYGLSYELICKAIDDKMAINRKRKWGEPKANGVVNHIRD